MNVKRIILVVLICLSAMLLCVNTYLNANTTNVSKTKIAYVEEDYKAVDIPKADDATTLTHTTAPRNITHDTVLTLTQSIMFFIGGFILFLLV